MPKTDTSVVLCKRVIVEESFNSVRVGPNSVDQCWSYSSILTEVNVFI